MKNEKPVSKLEEARARAIVQRAMNQQKRADVEKARRLIGRCFKYLNRYSDGESWWLYAIVIAVDDDGRLTTTNLQTDSNGHVSIQPDTYGGLLPHGGWIAIAREEFDAACAVIARQFLSALASAQSLGAVGQRSENPI